MLYRENKKLRKDQPVEMISQTLKRYLTDYDIAAGPEALSQFDLYYEMLIEWNGKVNLTAITEPDAAAVKHFLDSLLLLKAVDIPQNASLIDVGTGAGFPGIPLKILRPDLQLTLLDSLTKRTVFLKALSGALNQDNSVIHGRAEELGHAAEMREKFDFATARGVAALPALSEYCLPFVKPDGIFAALKGPGAQTEAAESKAALGILKGELSDIKSFTLPYDNHRTILLIKKISQMPPKYPRNSVKITKKPL